MRRGSELDPFSAVITGDLVWLLAFQGKYEAAKEQARKATELDPISYNAGFFLGYADIEGGRFNEAIPELEKVRAMNSPPFVAGFLGYAYARTGDHGKAEATIRELNQMSSRRFVSPFLQRDNLPRSGRQETGIGRI